MCGFFGVVGNLEKFKIETIKDSAEMVRHRGPDKFNIQYCDNAIMASARLKVVGLSQGEQPSKSNGYDYLVYNGEIFNFQSLQIRFPNLTLNSRSDTENLYQFLNNGYSNNYDLLEGQFAFANWNISTGKLTLARDRNGEKPLYYKINHDYVIFSSSADAITNMMENSPEIEKSSISNYFSNGWLASNESFFKGIVQLEPGEKLTWRANEIKRELFIRNPKNFSKSKDLLDNKVVELAEIFKDVINRQLDADVQVGVFLSGGIDSSILASFAAEKSDSINAFSIQIPGQNDDGPRSSSIAKSLGIKQYITDFNESEFYKSLDIYMRKFDTPISDSGVLPLISLVANAKKYASVALAGEGGDELFAGYPWAYSRFIGSQKSERSIFFENLVLRIKRRLTTDLEREANLSNMIIANLNPYLQARDVQEKFDSKYNLLGASEIQNMGLKLDKSRFTSPATFGLQDALSWDRKHYLVNDLLVKADRSSMALGFELRLPFLSDAVIQFAQSLPPEFLINHKETKIILRRLIESKIPGIRWDGQKYGLGIPAKNISGYIDLDREVKSLLSLPNIIAAFSKAEISETSKYFLKNFQTKWMAFMLLKWMSIRF